MKRLLLVCLWVTLVGFFTVSAFAQDSDGDGIADSQDNCPNHPNGSTTGTCINGGIAVIPCTIPGLNETECGTGGYCSMNQDDTYPPGGNGCGDACECEGNFDGDENQIQNDYDTFFLDYGRTDCTPQNPCIGDFDCDGDVDGETEPPYSGDFAIFMQDFGRTKFANPCPTNCVTVPWCNPCEGDFDNDGDQDGTDASLFKSDFGRSSFSRPCPPEPTTTTTICDTTTSTTTPAGCPYGMIDCGDKCVDPMTDRDYCGADMNCLEGTACGTGELCVGGVCVLSCPPGQINCGGQCVNTESDESHCGGCFNPCGSGELCVASSCEVVASCDPPAPVPRTGQITSYYEGDDGDLQKGVPWPDPRFTDNGDGTVTDNLTGLIWLKDAGCFYLGRYWPYAVSQSRELASGACGLTDGSNPGNWRLANVSELLSLISYAGLPSNHPFINVGGWYWTSTRRDSYAWAVNMANVNALDGIVRTLDWGDLDSINVWPVRDP